MLSAIATKKAGLTTGLMAALGAALLLGMVQTVDAGDRRTAELHNAQIAGEVLGMHYRQPISGAVVTVTRVGRGVQFTARTVVDRNGAFSFSGLRSGDYIVEVFASERRYSKRIVTLRAGETARLIFLLMD